MNVVRSALQAGVVLDGVNIMAMNYGEWAAPTSGPDSQTLGYYATTAAQGTHNQLTLLYREFGHVFDWNQVGVTPMIGVNDLTMKYSHLMMHRSSRVREKRISACALVWSVARDNPGSQDRHQQQPLGSICQLVSVVFSGTMEHKISASPTQVKRQLMYAF